MENPMVIELGTHGSGEEAYRFALDLRERHMKIWRGFTYETRLDPFTASFFGTESRTTMPRGNIQVHMNGLPVRKMEEFVSAARRRLAQRSLNTNPDAALDAAVS
jgi:hypothetical protein